MFTPKINLSLQEKDLNDIFLLFNQFETFNLFRIPL